MALLISNSQMDELAKRQFEEKLIATITQGDAAAASELRTPEGRKEIRRQCERAGSYGFVDDPDIARYVATAWIIGVDFDTEFGAMQEVLNHPKWQPAQKGEAIEKITMAVLQELDASRS